MKSEKPQKISKEKKKLTSAMKKEYSDEPQVKVEQGKASSSVLKKRTRKQAKMIKSDFLDFEAAESDRDERKGRRSVKFEDEEYRRGKSNFCRA